MLYPVENEIRQVKNLCGIWKFKKETMEEEGFQEKWYEKPLTDTIEMPVPSSYNDVTTDASLRDHVGWVWYEKTFSVPKAWKEERMVLRFGSVTHHAVVYLNGEEIARHKGGFLPFEADVTDKVLTGNNRLTVAVSNLLDWTCLPVGEHRYRKDYIYPNGIHEQDFHFDFFNYAGIHRPVKLYTTPKTYIEDITVVTDIDGTDGIIHYTVAVQGDADVQISVLDESGNSVTKVAGKEGVITIADAHLWEPGAAYLYELDITAGEDHYTLPIGIRTVSVTDKQFLINGKPFYFKGFGRHEDSHVRGKGLDEVLNTRDFNLMKWMGANSFRTSHYPYSEEMMQMADRQGVIIIDEVPAVGMNMFNGTSMFNPDMINDTTLSYHKQTLTDLYQRDKNHPCVIMWSIANEANTGEEGAVPYFTAVSEHIRSVDSTRPIAIIMNTLAKDDLVGHLFDVIGINRYYGWYDETGRLESIYPMMVHELTAWREKYHKPMLVAEYGCDTITGLHKLPMVMFSEEYQIETIKENNRAIDACDFVIGEHVWVLADFMTTSGLKRIDGNKKGIFTRDRQPKSIAYVLKDRWTKMEK